MSAEHELTEFERRVLERIALDHPERNFDATSLRVGDREYTGVGVFVNFEPPQGGFVGPKGHLGVRKWIALPELRYGIDALLFVTGPAPTMLELKSFQEPWDGKVTSFDLDPPKG